MDSRGLKRHSKTGARVREGAKILQRYDRGHGKFNAGRFCPPRLSVSLHFDATCIPAWSGADFEADSTVIVRGVISKTDMAWFSVGTHC